MEIDLEEFERELQNAVIHTTYNNNFDEFRRSQGVSPERLPPPRIIDTPLTRNTDTPLVPEIDTYYQFQANYVFDRPDDIIYDHSDNPTPRITYQPLLPVRTTEPRTVRNIDMSAIPRQKQYVSVVDDIDWAQNRGWARFYDSWITPEDTYASNQLRTVVGGENKILSFPDYDLDDSFLSRDMIEIEDFERSQTPPNPFTPPNPDLVNEEIRLINALQNNEVFEPMEDDLLGIELGNPNFNYEIQPKSYLPSATTFGLVALGALIGYGAYKYYTTPKNFVRSTKFMTKADFKKTEPDFSITNITLGELPSNFEAFLKIKKKKKTPTPQPKIIPIPQIRPTPQPKIMPIPQIIPTPQPEITPEILPRTPLEFLPLEPQNIVIPPQNFTGIPESRQIPSRLFFTPKEIPKILLFQKTSSNVVNLNCDWKARRNALLRGLPDPCF
tara:strand:+ start:712 stop:2037 length:1326 start_codon:yes stop_codon:yes gene_type:complete